MSWRAYKAHKPDIPLWANLPSFLKAASYSFRTFFSYQFSMSREQSLEQQETAIKPWNFESLPKEIRPLCYFRIAFIIKRLRGFKHKTQRHTLQLNEQNQTQKE